MKWYYTQKGEFPKNEQEVFIIVDGINYTATYNESKKTFTVKNLKNVSFCIESKKIFWAEIETQQAG